MVVYKVPFGRTAGPAAGNPAVRAIVRDWQILRHHAVQVGTSARRDRRACNLPSAGTCYADFNPSFSGAVRINGDYGDGDGSARARVVHRSHRVPVARGIHLRQHARTLAFDLRTRATSIRI